MIDCCIVKMAGSMAVKMVGSVVVVEADSRVCEVTVKMVGLVAENWIDEVVGWL